ncbi:TPA_asm: acyltransferase [Salmonella enterica subsp. salamae]|uniref:Acyltransferase n=1 Tax=Salmonella enterica subsp. salamae TaxID=59202 RepID=A0A702L6I1_SALER|nr:phage DNA ejection protein [Salmonella enterica subsp. salamae serovar 9,46:l,w:e,n,x]HAC6954187.1 acyltransferase [Salmonella enterica subsp. salamae]
MATWNQGINSGGFLAGIGTQNENAPKVSDANTALAYIRQNNEDERSGRNNVGLQALQGIAGTMQGIQQYNQRQEQKAFDQVHANAWATGDSSGLIEFARENPAFVSRAQQAFSGLAEQQRNELGQLAMQTNTALAQGPEAFSKFVTDNSDKLKRIGADPNWMLQTGISNPDQLSHLTTTMAYGAVGPDKMLDYQDRMVGRQLEQGRLNESVRQADMENSRGWANIQNAQLDRAQRAQMHSDDMGLKLMEMGQKGKPSADLIKGLNSDITSFGKNYNAVKSAANSLQALSKVNTGAAQLGIIFNYMKSLDPQSVVREGEQVQVMRSDGIWGQMKGYVDQLNAGNGLSQEARDNIVNAAKINANAMGQQFNQQVDEYLDTYGDTIPQGLKKSLGGRKAKLFDDVPAQSTPQGGNGKTKAAPSGISEGATATNPKTGQKLIYRNGQWQPM